MTYLPSKKFILVLGALTLAGSMVFVASKRSESSAKTSSIKVTTATPTLQRDTDNDGLKDWEEAIAGTDPQNPDSDGNGVSDGKETANALLFKEKVLTEGQEAPLPTQKLLEQFSAYANAQLDTNGALLKTDFDKTTAETLITPAVAEAREALAQRTPYTDADVKIDDTVTVKEYFNSIGRILETYFSENPQSPTYETEVTILRKLAERLQNNSANPDELMESLDRIAGFRAKYIGTALDLQEVRVPTDAQDLHLELLNSFANTALALHNITLIDRDPILGMLGIEMYSKEVVGAQKVLIRAQVLVKKENITFDNSDSRYARIYFSPQLQ